MPERPPKKQIDDILSIRHEVARLQPKLIKEILATLCLEIEYLRADGARQHP